MGGATGGGDGGGGDGGGGDGDGGGGDGDGGDGGAPRGRAAGAVSRFGALLERGGQAVKQLRHSVTTTDHPLSRSGVLQARA